MVGAHEGGQRIDEQDHVAARFDPALRTGEGHLREFEVATGRFVERRRDDVAARAGQRTAERRDLFGAFVDEADGDVDVGVVVQQRGGELL